MKNHSPPRTLGFRRLPGSTEPSTPAGRQRGGALFVALSLLIVISLLGLAAARVTALQERMAGVYLADLRSFQTAEQRIRNKEREVEVAMGESCDPLILDEASPEPWRDIRDWRNGTIDVPSTIIGVVDFGGLSGDKAEVPVCPFLITALEFSDDNRTTRSIVQSVFIP